MVGRTLYKTFKIALTKELGESVRLVYVIKMENTYEIKSRLLSIPSNQQENFQSQQVDAP